MLARPSLPASHKCFMWRWYVNDWIPTMTPCERWITMDVFHACMTLDTVQQPRHSLKRKSVEKREEKKTVHNALSRCTKISKISRLKVERGILWASGNLKVSLPNVATQTHSSALNMHPFHEVWAQVPVGGTDPAGGCGWLARLALRPAY